MAVYKFFYDIMQYIFVEKPTRFQINLLPASSGDEGNLLGNVGTNLPKHKRHISESRDLNHKRDLNCQSPDEE